MILWWNSQFGYNTSRSAASEILPNKYSSLDNSNINGKVKKDQKPKWPTLEQALAYWALQFESLLYALSVYQAAQNLALSNKYINRPRIDGRFLDIH